MRPTTILRAVLAALLTTALLTTALPTTALLTTALRAAAAACRPRCSSRREREAEYLTAKGLTS